MPAGEPGHLVERAALPHPQPAAGHPAHEPVDDQMALAPGDMVGPGDLQEGVLRRARSATAGSVTATLIRVS